MSETDAPQSPIDNNNSLGTFPDNLGDIPVQHRSTVPQYNISETSEVPIPIAAENDGNHELLLSPEELRTLLHGSKYFVNASLDTRKIPADKILFGGTGVGWHSMGTIPADTLGSFSLSYTTEAKMKKKHGDLNGPAATRKLKQSFRDNDIEETLTITRTKITHARVDPTSDKAGEPLVIFTYEKDVTDHIGRTAPFTLSICLPDSEAKIFEAAVVADPHIIREATDIVMLEELTAGDAWNGEKGISRPGQDHGSKLALRSDFTQGPQESQQLPI